MPMILEKLGWLASHPSFRKQPFRVASRVVKWGWQRRRGQPIILALDRLHIKARPRDGIGRLLCYFGEEADELFVFMKRYLKPGMTVVDVGANIGSHALMAGLLVTPSGRVLAFEADPETYRLLCENIALNSIGNIDARNQCLSDRRGLVTFNIDRDSAKSSIVRNGVSAIAMEADTLDSKLSRNGHIDLLKIDVEGADYLVLKGAIELLKRRPPSVVVVETTSNGAEIQELLASYRYCCLAYDGAATFTSPVGPLFNTYAIHETARAAMADFILPKEPR